MPRLNLTLTDDEMARLHRCRGRIRQTTYGANLLAAALLDAESRLHIDANGRPCVTDPNQLPLTEKK